MTTPYDAASKDLIEFSPADWLALLGAPRPPEIVRVVDADLSGTVSTATNKVIRVEDPEPWLAMIELRASWDGDMPFDLLRRYAQLRHRHWMPVSCAIILLRPEANTSAMTGTFVQPNPLGGAWDFPFQVVRVWEQPAESYLRGPLALIPLAPLGAVDPEDVPRVLSMVRNGAYGEVSRARADTLWQATIQLLALRYDERLIDQWKGIMATLDISKTPLVRMYRRGEAQDAIRRMGAKKFGPPPPDVEASLAAIHDLQQLHDLQSRLMDVADWHQLLSDGP